MHTDKKVAVIGGGHGTSIVLSSLDGSGCGLSAILSMADDGGSTGRLRAQYGVSPPGDIRQCLVALSTNPELADLYSFRFREGELDGHSLGNLMLAAGELNTGSMARSIAMAKKALGVNADIIPVTTEHCNLLLELNGKEVRGVYRIANTDLGGEKPGLRLDPEARLSSPAKEAIEKTDLLVIAPGNFYCSIMPALLTSGTADVINASKAKVVYICNLLNRSNHTRGFVVNDYVEEINRLTGGVRIDEVIYNTAEINPHCIRQGERPVGIGEGDLSSLPYKLVGREISDDEKAPAPASDKIAAVRSLARHDKRKLGKVLEGILENI